MPGVKVHVTGQKELERVAAVLADRADGKKLKRAVTAGIRDETGPITREQRTSLAAGLPHRGGLAETLATEGRFSTRTALTVGRTVAVDIIDSWKGHDIGALDKGTARHPLFGKRKRGQWFNTSVKKELLTRPVLAHKYGIARSIGRRLDVFAEEIAKET